MRKNDDVNDSQAKIKEIIDDKCLTVGGRDYFITPTTHENRLKISSFLTSVSGDLQKGDMSFINTKEYKEVVKIIDNMTLYEDMLLAKIKDHWEYYPVKEYYTFYITMMTVAVELLPVRPTN